MNCRYLQYIGLSKQLLYKRKKFKCILLKTGILNRKIFLNIQMPTTCSQKHPCGCKPSLSAPMFGVSRPTFYLQPRNISRNSSSPRFKLSLPVSPTAVLCCRQGKERGMRAEDFCPLFIPPSSNLCLSTVVD